MPLPSTATARHGPSVAGRLRTLPGMDTEPRPTEDGPEFVVLCHPDDAERVAMMRGVGPDNDAELRTSALVPRGQAYVMPAEHYIEAQLPPEELATDWRTQAREMLAELRADYLAVTNPPPRAHVQITGP